MTKIRVEILAANGDESGWAQLLVFIIIAVIYALAGLTKARSDKNQREANELNQGEDKSKVTSNKNKLKSPQMRRPPKPKHISSRPSEMAKKLQGKAERQQKTPSKMQSPTDSTNSISEIMNMGVNEPLDSEEQNISPKTEKNLKVDDKKASEKNQRKIEIDIDSPGDLRRAILHYEIFGQPKSLRRPEEV